MFWRKKPADTESNISTKIEPVVEVNQSASRKLEIAAEKLTTSLREYSDAAYLASKSEPDNELEIASSRIESARKLVLDGRLAYALGRCIPEHVKYWPAWIDRDDFQSLVEFDAVDIVASKATEKDSLGKIDITTIDFSFNDCRYRLIFRDCGMSYAPDTSERLGSIELYVGNARVVKFELVEDLAREYSRWEFQTVSALKVGPWMTEVIDIATQIDANWEKRKNELINKHKLKVASEIDLNELD